ncbi:organic cation/carnitine transporter 2-like isoform X4 [Clavelina lepadiformis]|uniref:organic cation/carnitine transporter 2-like isoform X4 n=1 Tax=Clavelina lepadiformis TaxID=159417 RepID=UPI0040429347
MNLKKLLRSNDFGYYEKRLCFLLFLSSIPNAFPLLQSLVNNYTPPFRCDVSSIVNKEAAKNAETFSDEQWKEHLLNLTIPYEENETGNFKRSSCTRYNVSLEYLQNLTNHSYVPSEDWFEDQTTVSCSKFHFEGVETSVVTEFGLVCDRAWLRPFFVSVYMLGLTVGVLCGGIVSDRYGRKFTFLLFTALQFIVAFATGFATTPVFYGTMLFFSGWTNLVNYGAAVLLGSEFVASEYRSFAYFVLGAGYGVGITVLGPIMYFARNWRWFMVFTGLVGIPYISYYWLIDESPLWLAAKGKDEELERVLRKVARINKQKQKSKEEIKKLLPSENDKAQSYLKAGRELVLNRTMMGRLLVAGFCWCTVSISYYVIILNANNLTGNRFVNVAISGAMEILALIVFHVIVDSFGRRKSYMTAMTGCAVGIAFSPLAATWNAHLVLVLSMFCRFTTGLGFAIVYVYHVEFFPTPTRQTVMGICSACARIGGIISPYILHAGENGETVAPCLGMAAVILLSVASNVFLPETRDQPLPQNVEDALKMKGLLPTIRCNGGKEKSDRQSVSSSINLSRAEAKL